MFVFVTAGDSRSADYCAEFQGYGKGLAYYANNIDRPICAAQLYYG